MFENIVKFFKKFGKNDKENSKSTAKERLHLVLAQDRANISADFLEMMKQEIIEVIKKYIDIDEEAIDVRMTNKPGEDGTVGAPALYANIPIVTIKNEARKLEGTMAKEKSNTNTAENKESENKENKEIDDKKKDSEEISDNQSKSKEADNEKIENEEEKNIEEKQEEQDKKDNTSNEGDEEKDSIEEDKDEEKNS